MNAMTMEKADVRLFAGGAIVYLLLVASGALSSPLLPLASVWLFHATLHAERRRVLAFFAGASLLLLATESADPPTKRVTGRWAAAGRRAPRLLSL